MEMADNQNNILSVGTRLRSARQAVGMSIHDVSQHTKLSTRQIEAIENNGFDELGLVFSRGFVRNYARLVGLDANALVAEMSSTLQSKAESLSIHDEHIPLTNSLSKYWLIMAGFALTLVIGVPLLVYHWLSADDMPIKVAAVTKSAIQASVTMPAATAPKPAPAPVPTANPQPEPVVPAPTAPAESEPANTTAPSTDNPTMGRVQFQFTQDAWVEIRDGKQHAVLSHLYRAGETAEISGTPPLSLIIGNAAHVSLKYNDHAVDLAPHTAVSVARLTLQ